MKDQHQDIISSFQGNFLSFRIDEMEDQAKKLLEAGITIQDFLNACLPCMDVIGEKFEAGEYFLPQLIGAGEMFKIVKNRITKSIKSENPPAVLGKIVLGTPKGDIHNIGKDIFAALAEASGFAVHDLGVEVLPEMFILELEKTGASILGMSCLLTTTFDSVRDVVNLLEEKGLREGTTVIIGGAATDQGLLSKLNVDMQTRNAITGVTLLKSGLKKSPGNKKEVTV